MDFFLEWLSRHQHVALYAATIARASVWFVILMAVFVPLEQAFALHKERVFYKGWLTNVGWYFVNSLLPIFLLGPPAALIAWAVHALLPDAVTGAAASLPLWARMILAMIVGEIGFYWGHRWSHELPLLWRFHSLHHSAAHISFLVNTLGHPVDLVFTRLCGLILLYATGLAAPVGPNPALVPALVLMVGAVWSFFVHANVRWRLGPLEQVISTPAFHHWHHTYEDHKDHNYAPMLPFMDRIFGTFYLPAHWPERYGTASPVATDLLGQFVDPFAPSFARLQGASTEAAQSRRST